MIVRLLRASAVFSGAGRAHQETISSHLKSNTLRKIICSKTHVVKQHITNGFKFDNVNHNFETLNSFLVDEQRWRYVTC